MSVLSDRDIIRELGRGILFYPLKPGSIKACDLCLTASEYAYAIGQKQRLLIQTEPKTGKLGEEQKFFYVPPRDTALVWTDESVYLSNRFRGPLYSISSEVSRGIGHIGTRVNPCWTAVLCISLHNVSEEPQRINVRDVNQPIAYLAIEKLSSSSLSNRNSDNPARLDILRGRPNSQEIFDYFNQKEHSWMMGNTDLLKKLMLASDEYKTLKRGVHDTLLSLLGPDTSAKWAAIAAIGTLISAIFAGLPYIKHLYQLFQKSSTPQTQAEPNNPVNPTSTK